MTAWLQAMKSNGPESGRTWWDGYKPQNMQDFLSSFAAANHPMTTSWKWMWTKKVEVHDEMVSQGTCNIFMELLVSNTVYKVSKFFSQGKSKNLENGLDQCHVCDSWSSPHQFWDQDFVSPLKWCGEFHDSMTIQPMKVNGPESGRTWWDGQLKQKIQDFLFSFASVDPPMTTSWKWMDPESGRTWWNGQSRNKDGHWSSKRTSWNDHSKNLQHFVSVHENFCHNILMEFW